MPGGVGFGDSEFPESRLDIPLVPGKHPHDYPEDAEIELGESAVELNLTTDDIARLDSVLFDNRNGASRLGLELSVDNLRLDGGDAEMVFRASFPEGYRLAAETGQDGSFTGSEYTCTIPMRELAGSQKTVRLLLQKAVVGADDRIAYNASLRIKKGSSLSVSGSPGLRISGGISSPDFRVIYGLIDDNFTAGQVDIATEGLDDLFDGDDNVLSFADPRIRLTAQSNIGIPLRASFAMTSVNDRSGATESVTVDRITMNAPGAYGQTAVSNIWLGASDRDVPAEYTFTACPVNDLIRISSGRYSDSYGGTHGYRLDRFARLLLSERRFRPDRLHGRDSARSRRRFPRTDRSDGRRSIRRGSDRLPVFRAARPKFTVV